jgi:hypothetical protein
MGWEAIAVCTEVKSIWTGRRARGAPTWAVVRPSGPGVIIGADGFSLDTAGPAPSAFKLGE